MRGNQPRPFQRLLLEREFKREEIEMLHRMTTLLSTVVIAFLAAPVVNAMFSTAARAADSCLARPTGAAPNGSRWQYQTDPITRRKCWVLDGPKTTVQGGVLPRLLAFGSSNEVAERPTAASCIAAPNGQAPRGRHWAYRLDNATGRRCWHLGDEVSRIHVSRNQASGNQVSKIHNAIASRVPVASVAPETLAAVLPLAVADANARLVDTSNAPPSRIESASSPAAAGISETANENVAPPTFESRWTDPSDQVGSSDRAAKPVDLSELRQPDPAVPDDVARSTKDNAAKDSGHLPATGRPLDVTLLIFLGSLGGALVLFGLAGRSFFYERSRSAVWPNLPPPHDVLRVAEFGSSSSNSPGDGAERGHEAASDWQNAMDALLRLVGGRPTDRDPSRAQRHAADDLRLEERRDRQSKDNGSEQISKQTSK
jgi:hypothetical protein